MNEFDLVKAIRKLKPNAEFTFNESDYSSIKWEWDGRYLKNYNNSSQKYELPSGAPVPVWAVVYGIIN